MPIGRSAKKSLRKSLKNRKVNVGFKNKLKLVLKTYVEKPSEDGFKAVMSVLDKGVKKHLVHINKVGRTKSRLSKMLVTEAPIKTEKKKTTAKRTAKEKMSK